MENESLKTSTFRTLAIFWLLLHWRVCEFELQMYFEYFLQAEVRLKEAKGKIRSPAKSRILPFWTICPDKPILVQSNKPSKQCISYFGTSYEVDSQALEQFAKKARKKLPQNVGVSEERMELPLSLHFNNVDMWIVVPKNWVRKYYTQENNYSIDQQTVCISWNIFQST